MLTDRGENILEESGGKDFVDENFEELNEEVENMNGNTPYDIQENSKKVIEKHKDDQDFDDIKKYFFEEGEQIDDIVLAMGIYLRNKILSEKGVPIEEIDKHSGD